MIPKAGDFIEWQSLPVTRALAEWAAREREAVGAYLLTSDTTDPYDLGKARQEARDLAWLRYILTDDKAREELWPDAATGTE